MTRGDLVVITPVPDDLIVNKTGAVQNHFMLSMFRKKLYNQLEMRESTTGQGIQVSEMMYGSLSFFIRIDPLLYDNFKPYRFTPHQCYSKKI
jgi:hypothetical protein